MSNRTNRTMIGLAIATLAFVSYGFGGTATAQYPEDAPNASDGVDESDLIMLAPIFNEVPGSISTGDVTGDSLGSAKCGASGHCSYMTCPQPRCDPSQTVSCQCTSTDIKCKDRHVWYDPFDDDEHNMYDCACSCVGNSPPPPPPEEEEKCYVTWPVKVCEPDLGAGDVPPLDLPECFGTRTSIPDFGGLGAICEVVEKARQTADDGTGSP